MPRRCCSTASGSPKPLRVTFAPSAAKARAIPRPIPDVEPVTTTDFPRIILTSIPPACGRRCASAFGCRRCGFDGDQFGDAADGEDGPHQGMGDETDVVGAGEQGGNGGGGRGAPRAEIDGKRAAVATGLGGGAAPGLVGV